MLFMLDGDVERFDVELGSRISGLACWLTQETNQADLTPHGSLTEALCCNRVQAFLRLLDEDGEVFGPVIQYLPTDFAVSAFGARTASDDPHSVMRSGRLAYKWLPGEESPETQAQFTELAELTWRVLYASSAPHLVTMAGKPRRNARIGSSAKQWALQHPNQKLLEFGDTPLRIRVESQEGEM